MSILNLIPLEQQIRPASDHWFYLKDAAPEGLILFQRHYSFRPYKDGRTPKLFVGPGEKLVLIDANEKALFVWRKFKSGDGQEGVNCMVFRNESEVKSSSLITEASDVAWQRWPNQRLYTYVNPRKIRSSNPGCCFKKAGWRTCGITKWNRLVILEIYPNPVREIQQKARDEMLQFYRNGGQKGRK